MKWDKIKLRDISDKIGSGATPTGGNSSYKTEGISLIRSQNVHDLNFSYAGLALIDETQAEELSNVVVCEGDILLNITGDSVARVCKVPENVLPARVNQHVAIIRLNEIKADSKFVLYHLLNDKSYLLTLAQGGSTRNALTKGMLEELEIPMPPLPIQHRIAEVLGRYDALIENYQRQIGLLEALAQNLYREWFVRGRCPDAQAQAGGLPVGWEAKRLGDIAADARRIVKIEEVEPTTPYVGLEHLSVKSIVIRDCGVVEDVDSDKLAFEPFDILFGKIRPYLHKVCLSHFSGVCSSDAIVIKPKLENALGFVMFTVFDEHFIEFADKISNGTKMPRAEWSVLQTYPLIIPSSDALERFDETIKPIFAKIGNLQSQITRLRQMRDKLLPRLMSGQLAVNAS